MSGFSFVLQSKMWCGRIIKGVYKKEIICFCAKVNLD